MAQSETGSIFEEQISRKPNKYPWTEKFIEVMHEGFWTDKEFTFQSDLHQFKTVLNDQEREIIIRTLSGIGQIEVAVKTFWARLGENLPHPSLNDLGYVMANVEVIHNNAYERLLTVLGLEDIFEENLKLDFIEGRVKYLRKHTHRYYKDSKKQYLYALILFTLFVENCSLFTQFYVINWFGTFKNVLKDTDQQVVYTKREECLIEGTEVLTPTGWTDLREINVGDPIYQYNVGGTIEETKVLHKVKNSFDGDMIRFTRSGNECVVTPDHDMVYYNIRNEFIRKKAKDLKIHKEILLPLGGILENQGISDLSFEDRLRIAIQADGSNLHWTNLSGEKKLRGANKGRTHSMSLTKKRKQDRLEWILSNLDLEYKKTVSKDGSGKTHYILRYNQDHDYKHFDSWIDLSNKTSEWCDKFIEECVEWDGYKEHSHRGYCSIVKKNVDLVQTIAILAGYSTNIYEASESLRKESYSNCFKLSIMSRNLKPRSHGIKKSPVPYKGEVYCVTVPSGNIITRLGHNTFITGNCVHALVGIKIIETIREEHPELFDEELEEKIIQESKEAFKAESKIIDWMVNGIDEEGLSAPLLKEFMKNRINESLVSVGFKQPFETDQEMLKDTLWFDEQLHGYNMTDFFHAKPTQYSKKNQSFGEDSLF